MSDASSEPSTFSSTPAPTASRRPWSVVALGGAEMSARIVAFATATLLARRLGPELLGVLGFAAALYGYFSVAVSGGLNDVAGREVAQRPYAAGAVYRKVLGVRLPIAIAAILSLAAFALWLPRPFEHRAIIALTGLSLLAVAVDPLWVFKALQRPWVVAAGMVTVQAVVLVAVFALVGRPEQALRVPLAQFGAEFAVAAVLLVLLRRLPSAVVAVPSGRMLLRQGLPLLFGRGMRTVIVTFDVVLLGFVGTARDLGIYSAVYRVHFFVLALVVALQGASFPLLARAAADGPDRVNGTTDNVLAGGAIVGAPLVAGGLVMAEPLLAFLFGSPYNEGARALQWLLVSLGLVFIHGLLHNVYVVTGRANVQARWFALGAVVNVFANLWLIPRYGIAGAAAATALAEAVITAGAVFVSRLTSPLAIGRAWAVPACAAAVMALVVGSTRHLLPVPLVCALGAVVYGTLILGLLGRSTTATRLGF